MYKIRYQLSITKQSADQWEPTTIIFWFSADSIEYFDSQLSSNFDHPKARQVNFIKQFSLSFVFYQIVFFRTMSYHHHHLGQHLKSYRVFIKGLPEPTLVVDLLPFFDGFGLIRNIVVRGYYGIVYFCDQEDAQRAIYRLNGTFFRGHRVVLRWYYYRKRTNYGRNNNNIWVVENENENRSQKKCGVYTRSFCGF